MEKIVIKCFTCPICTDRHMGRVNRNLHYNMLKHFPQSYALGMLICDGCLPQTLKEMNKV